MSLHRRGVVMAPTYRSRDIVEDFLRHRLHRSGLLHRSLPRGGATGAQRRRTSLRSGPTTTSHQGVAREDTDQDPCLDPPCLQIVLRCTGDELERRYRGDLAAQVSVLLLCGGDRAERQRSLTAISEELFNDGVNWGRIVAMMELGGALCTEVVRRGGAWQVDDITNWMEETLESPPLQDWIEANGGWEAFVEMFSGSRRPAPFWSLRTLIGLVLLAAAGVTLGALLSRR